MWQACEEMVEQQLLRCGLSWVHWGVAETLNLDARGSDGTIRVA